MPYSGPLSAAGVIGKSESAYFRMINDQGGINGRHVTFISLDDGYSPSRTLEQTRRLVEQDQVLAIMGSFGTPPNAAIHQYLNTRQVPQLFIQAGAARWKDPAHFPRLFNAMESPGLQAGYRCPRERRGSGPGRGCWSCLT
jgi:branched-chain amino acid transport system substrate-binding protein